MTDEAWLERDGGLRILHLARQPVNALHTDFVEAIRSCIDGVVADPEARAVLLVSDTTVFAAGADIQALEDNPAPPTDPESFGARVQSLFTSIERLPLPVVAAIGGHALGGGLELALAADVTIVADDPAIKLGLPEARIGVLPGAGGTQRLARLLGKTRALDLMLSGRSLDPLTALAWGIVTEVVPPDDLERRAREVAAGFATGPTAALAAIKACVLHAVHDDIERGLTVERERAAALLDTADAAEGLRAFLERRPPTFLGR